MTLYSDNEPFLDAMGYDSEDPGEDIVHGPWTPDAAGFERYLDLDALHAIGNVAMLEALERYAGYGSGRVTITNGREPGHGYGAISVHVGGAHPDDCLHTLSAFGRAREVLRHRK